MKKQLNFFNSVCREFANIGNSATGKIMTICLVVMLLIIFLDTASAASRSGTAFDAPLDKLTDIFTGPIAFTVSILGILVAGVMLVFGGEISDFAKRMVMLVLVIALVAFAAQILNQLFGVGGATVSI